MLVDNVKTTNYYIYIYITVCVSVQVGIYIEAKSLINLNSKFNIVETINPQVD